jgi:hypothetical protein
MENSLNKVATNPKSLKYCFDFHQLMEQYEIIMVYAGEFSQALTKTLLSFTERKFNVEHIEDTVRRKIYNIMVEMLQNISKNALDNGVVVTKNSPVFMIGESEASYFLISSNKIGNENIPTLKSRIDQVNLLDSEGLKQLYKEVRISGTFSKVGGAGIGVIDMARKSENKLGYDFNPINDQYSMFTLFIQVSRNSLTN